MDRESLVTLTADIVAAHVSNNNVAIADMPVLVQRIHQALAGLSEGPAEAEAQAKTPVVSVRASLKPDYLVCMECGRRQKTLKRHLMTAHSMTPDQYRQDYGLPASYPMTAPNYSETRSALAKTLGLGRKRGEAKPAGGRRKGRGAAKPA